MAELSQSVSKTINGPKVLVKPRLKCICRRQWSWLLGKEPCVDGTGGRDLRHYLVRVILFTTATTIIVCLGNFNICEKVL